MEPRLREAEYLFCRLPEGKRLPERVLALAAFEDAEGTTSIVERARAERAGVAGAGPYAMITLELGASEPHDVVASAAQALAAAGIPANAVAAYGRDHLFVPAEGAEHALAVLRALAAPGGE
jgi:hypothetical protein